jgi:hypothetical protein
MKKTQYRILNQGFNCHWLYPVDTENRFHLDFSQKDKVLIFLLPTNGYSQKKELAFQPQKMNPKVNHIPPIWNKIKHKN